MYSGCVDAETYGMFAHENAFLILMLLSLLFPFSFVLTSIWPLTTYTVAVIVTPTASLSLCIAHPAFRGFARFVTGDFCLPI